MLVTDPVSDKSRGKGFGEKGMADRLYIRYGISQTGFLTVGIHNYRRSLTETMWIEWKRTVRGKATKPTRQQIDWHRYERALGALTLIAGEDFPATLEGFQVWYRASGLEHIPR